MLKIEELEKLLEPMECPEELRLDPGTLILDPGKFVRSHLEAVKANAGNRTFLPYYLRLLKFYNLLKKKE